MACGFGMSAVRALSKKLAVPSFRSRSKASSERTGQYVVPDEEDITKLAAVQPSGPTGTTFATLDERLLEGTIYSDHEESDSDDGADDDTSEPEGATPVRTQTLSLGGMPDPSQFMDPKWVNTFTKLYLEDSDAKVFDSEFDCASDADSSSSKEEKDEFPADAESDCEEMYKGPLQPKRTKAMKDFPSASEYLTMEELLLARKFFE
eukprot:TRINITY_DN14503_c0_g3_i2.p1 TRINITY_DN14503_c0_g3~~TRINITY_DN14503_c0_g3_i2.p1  ORF type:complete len:206 (+),score=57.58 TRINITY_DN14503_c0_g3_i2:99-716(+)